MRLRIAALLVMAIVAASFTSPVTASDLGFGMTATARVTAVRYYAELRQNVANLAGAFSSGASYEANFLANFDRTGGVERWGFPTSAIFEETRGTLTQYYQRGVVDWQPSPGGNRHTFQRRLAWDHLGGGLGGSRDQGVEPGLRNPHPGESIGPWGHKVSNRSVEGVWTGFADFFRRLGGVASFGYPKTDARRDTHPQAVLHDPGRPVDSRIRQYFQAAVLEYHPESASSPVKLRLLGDTLRNRKYPNNAWQQYPAFGPDSPLMLGDRVRIDLLSPEDPDSQVIQELSAAEVVELLRPSLLRIETDQGCGSGFFVTANGYAVTNWHVIEGARSISVTTTGGHRAAASIVAGDAGLDLALLAVSGVTHAAAIDWGNSATVPLGSQLVALGYGITITDAGTTCPPTPTVTSGLLSNRVTVRGREYLQTDAALSPGNSGGPVATLGGRVVGITVGTLRDSDSQNTNFLIPSERAEPVISSWLDTLGREGVPPVSPSPNDEPVVLAESSWQRCSRGNRVLHATGRNIELTATVTSKSYKPPFFILWFGPAGDEDGRRWDALAVGPPGLHGEQSLVSWQRKFIGAHTTLERSFHEDIVHGIPFHIRLVYGDGRVEFFINGRSIHLDAGQPYGEDIYLTLQCGGTEDVVVQDIGEVIFSDARITGMPVSSAP